MKKIGWMVSGLISAAVLSGCGSNSKTDGENLPGGKETGISIEYVASKYVAGKGLVNTYKVHVADQDGKPINREVRVSVINGVKKGSMTGIIHNTQPITFDDPSISFAGVSQGDKVIIFPSQGKIDPSYLGDWTVQSVGTTLTFKEGAYHMTEASGLHYLIGNEKRILGTQTGVVHIEKDANMTADGTGYVYFNVVADTILAGHTITVGAHTVGNRLGTALVDAVRGACFIGSKVNIPVTGKSYGEPMSLWIDPACEGVAQEPLIDVEINPMSFKVDDGCSINYAKSNFHTDSHGYVTINVETSVDENKTEGEDTCTLSWEGGAENIYLEY
jgi:hypothetical protein